MTWFYLAMLSFILCPLSSCFYPRVKVSIDSKSPLSLPWWPPKEPDSLPTPTPANPGAVWSYVGWSPQLDCRFLGDCAYSPPFGPAASAPLLLPRRAPALALGFPHMGRSVHICGLKSAPCRVNAQSTTVLNSGVHTS